MPRILWVLLYLFSSLCLPRIFFKRESKTCFFHFLSNYPKNLQRDSYLCRIDYCVDEPQCEEVLVLLKEIAHDCRVHHQACSCYDNKDGWEKCIYEGEMVQRKAYSIRYVCNWSVHCLRSFFEEKATPEKLFQ